MTTIPPTQDRDYYRGLEDRELIDAVRYAIRDRINWEELAIALAERLERTSRRLEDQHYDALCAREGY